jgi:hypothetical protein
MTFATIAAELLGDIGARRKQAFWLRKMISALAPILHRDVENGLPLPDGIVQRVITCLNKICPAYGIEGK